jgi:transposase-like protein
MTEKEQQRVIKRRLAIIQHADEVTGNVAATCRYFGISRQCFYTWLRRYEEEGEEGLRERSRRHFRSRERPDFSMRRALPFWLMASRPPSGVASKEAR